MARAGSRFLAQSSCEQIRYHADGNDMGWHFPRPDVDNGADYIIAFDLNLHNIDYQIERL